MAHNKTEGKLIRVYSRVIYLFSFQALVIMKILYSCCFKANSPVFRKFAVLGSDAG